jgi:hypothetical protein
VPFCLPMPSEKAPPQHSARKKARRSMPIAQRRAAMWQAAGRFGLAPAPTVAWRLRLPAPPPAGTGKAVAVLPSKHACLPAQHQQCPPHPHPLSPPPSCHGQNRTARNEPDRSWARKRKNLLLRLGGGIAWFPVP